MADLKTYDPKLYDIVFAGISLNEGLADGTFLTVAPDTPGFSKKVGVDGEVTRSRSHDRSATVTFTCMQTSDVNDRLSALYNSDRDAANGAGVGTFFIQDRAGRTFGEASKAYISDDPDLVLSGEAETREWTLELADWRPNHGGTPDE